MSWESFFTDLGKNVITKGTGAVVDYQIADKAKDNGYNNVANNMFNRPTPDTVPQEMNPSGLPNGKPVRVFTRADGSLNLPFVAGAIVLGALLIKKVA